MPLYTCLLTYFFIDHHVVVQIGQSVGRVCAFVLVSGQWHTLEMTINQQFELISSFAFDEYILSRRRSYLGF